MLSSDHVIQFDVYTLFCHYMMEHLESLYLACELIKGEPTVKTCTDAIDDGLKAMLELRTTDRQLALKIVASHFESSALRIGASKPDAGREIALAMEEALDNHASWSYQTEIENWHEQGRYLASLFFEKSDWDTTRKKLTRRASLEYQVGDSQTAPFFSNLRNIPDTPQRQKLVDLLVANKLREERKNYEGIPGALYIVQDEDPEKFSIRVPLTRQNDLMLFVSYPFLFMHEYSAHIFSADQFNDRFNDGWMLYAASRYLVNKWAGDEEFSKLNRLQAYAFKRHLWFTLSNEAAAHHDLAEDFHDFLFTWDRDRFDLITYELAAYEPTPLMEESWPTLILKNLNDDLRNRKLLKERMSDALTLDALYPDLKTKHSLG